MTDPTSDPVLARIDAIVKENPVVLFMKGTPSFPMCGFSARVAQVLGAVGVPYQAVNVLADPEIREGVKAYGEWPTIPQLYVGGELLGGCDITVELYESGELATLLERAAAAEPASETAADA
jgi:monothiol glutaredoxin